MAGELKHISVGAVLTQAEYEQVDGHTLDSMARGDIIRAASATAGDLTRLAVGAANTVLLSDGTDPSWGSILNAHIGAGAAIVASKIAAGTFGAGAYSLAGSTLDSAIIGSVTPAAGTFTTLTGSGVLSIDDTTESTSGTTGSIHTDGGLGVAKRVAIGLQAPETYSPVGLQYVTALATAEDALQIGSVAGRHVGLTIRTPSTDNKSEYRFGQFDGASGYTMLLLGTDGTVTLGDGGTVTQATSITTGVTLSKTVGQITTVLNPSIAAGAEATFTVTNTLVAAIDNIIVSVETQFTDGLVIAFVSRVAAGAFDITLTNVSAVAVSAGAAIINFALIKGSAT